MILVTGASGKVGSEAIRLLAARALVRDPSRALVGDPLRALVRDPSRAPRESAEVVVGDFDRPDTLDAALRGVDTVVLVSPAVPAQEIAVIDSAVRQGVTHIVKITSKASADSPVERRRGQAEIEAHLLASGLGYTLLRANAYMQNLLALAPMIKQTDGFVMSAGDGQVGMIDARDVAAVAATVAADPVRHDKRTYWLTGPELVTYAGVAAELSELLGRPIEYRRIPPGEHLTAMIRAGVPSAVATSNAQAFGLIASGDAAWLTGEVEAVTGRPPRSLRNFLLSAFKPA
jgi:uncharacterized protein YbjT (DUF2867 family)